MAYNKQVTWKKYPFPLENISFIAYKAAKILRTLPTDTFAKSFEKNSINTSFKGKISAKNFNNSNVIVIFLEGTSSRVLSDDVTPNIMKLRKNSIDIKNYFNHTAATFRGLRGQLISGFCLKGGRDYAPDLQGVDELARKSHAGTIPRIESLPYILEKRGYTTVFISPHDKNEGLASVMKNVGFQQVLTAENFGERFSDYLTDKQSYAFLWKELMALKSSKAPFFLCLYQLGTHHGMDSPDKKYGDKKNPYLNKFHNADFWLGEFVEKFLANSISENTFLILTADHATYSTPEYRKTFNTNTQYFIDEIPFIIFSKDISGKTIDADYRNSLSLAPTILDILGVDKANNHFLGDSIFFDGRENGFSKIACIGYECYHICKSGVKIIEDDSYREILELIHKYLSYSG
ncbi:MULTISPECIES: LTA synthase family protein [unclassified Desulfovibrio]|uniref:LTA synthase family protein n=1 Tax=unclassified Desulfovibrio TaxID=2593640 RepID=UPI0013EA4638|nr:MULTISPECIES: LTA synthase family protein [unclassified Desulfovibrio]